jgi:putative pyruvate formate lyase activating enzyme
MWFLMRPDALRVLEDEKAKKALKRYFQVVEDALPAKFMIAKRIYAPFTGDEDLEELWRIHDQAYREFTDVEKRIDAGSLDLEEVEKPDKSLLDLKVALAERILESCTLCERRCGKNRLEGELGWCRLGTDMPISSSFFHTGEEPELVPSYTVFTIGCTMRCLHCQNWGISQRYEEGVVMKPEELAREVEGARMRGARNLNMVGGDPTSWLWNWLRVAKELRKSIPLVWNSNTYYSLESARILQGFIDIYLLDFKYGRGECATKISSAPGYWEACTRNLLLAMESGELIIRILVLPEHIDCCYRPIVKWIAENLGRGVRVNVMHQYRPEYRAHEVPELRRRLDRDEREASIRIARELGLENFIT